MSDVAFKQEDDLVIVALTVPAGTKNRSIDVKFTETTVQAGLVGAPPLLQVHLTCLLSCSDSPGQCCSSNSTKDFDVDP